MDMRNFKVNGTEYSAKPFDFNLLADFEDMGISIGTLVTKPNVAMRAYLAVCGNISIKDAGEEINAHIVSGGLLDELADAMNNAMDESDFFQQMVRKAVEAAKEKKSQKKNTGH